MVFSDYESNTGGFVDITENGTKYIIPPAGTNAITAIWETPSVGKAGLIQFKIAGDEGSNPSEGTIDLSTDTSTVTTAFAIPVLDIETSGLATNGRVKLLFARF